jgi:hypothetical protein
MVLRFQHVALLSSAMFLVCACGSPKKEEEKRLNENTVTVTPAAGTYEYGVVLVFSKQNNDAGSGVLEFQKTDGSWSWAVGNCAGGVSGDYCLLVNESQTVNYRLSTTAGQSSVKTAAYTIQLQTKNLTLNGQAFTESQTDCAVSESNGTKSLSGRIKLTNNSVIGADKIAYAFFEVNDITKLNQELTVTSAFSDTGLQISSTGDSAPISPSTFSPGANSDSPTDNCKVTLTAFTAGQKATGTLECTLSRNQFQDTTALTKNLVITKGDWQCDRWVTSLLL